MSNQSSHTEVVNAKLGFARGADIVPDAERAGLLRIETRFDDAGRDALIEQHRCPLIDLGTCTDELPSLTKMGFDRIDLSRNARLQAELDVVRKASCLNRDNVRLIRKEMQGHSFRLAGGKRLRFLSIAPEGFVMRKSGPNGVEVAPDETVSELNGHKAATMVHGDQDVYGTPLKQMMKGVAPWLFRHRTPDGINRWSPVFLLNIWIPLQQCTQPLGLVDRRTLDNRQQQVRYALPTDSFLDRAKDMALNDIWLYLHDEAHKWYFDSTMDARSAYVFDTLGEAHGAATLPGEDVAGAYFVCLKQLREAVIRRESASLRLAANFSVSELPADTPQTLRRAIGTFEALLKEVQDSSLDALLEADWCGRCEQALDAVVRKSVEMRAVALVI